MTAYLIIAILGIGLVTGLRALTAPAVVSTALWLGYLHPTAPPLSFMANITAVVIFNIFAFGEYIGDKLPSAPARTALPGLIGRIVSGGLCGATVSASGGQSLITGSILGIAGALAGCYGGYYARTRLVKALGVKDLIVATSEDLVAIGLGCLFVSIAGL
jgi:uncharacterized membrane protein